jgi:hypothetical protein
MHGRRNARRSPRAGEAADSTEEKPSLLMPPRSMSLFFSFVGVQIELKLKEKADRVQDEKCKARCHV